MIQIVTELDLFYLTSMIPDIEVVCYDWVNFSLSRGGSNILSERYWGNNKGRAWIRNIGKIIAADLGEIKGLSDIYTISFSDGTTSESKQIRFMLCEKQINGKSERFISENFLTLNKGFKVVKTWQTEILSIYTSSNVDVTIETVDKDGVRVGPTLLRKITELNKVVEMNISPDNISSNADRLHRYIVKAGDRMMTYYIDHKERGEEPEMIFRNAFGCRESFILGGYMERNNEYESSTGYIRDMLFRFRTKEIKKFSCNTGLLKENQSEWVEDLIVSNEVFLMLGSDLIPITITGAEVSRNNSRAELISFNFDYQLSKPNIYGAGKIDIKRIFDDTFDYTFH